MRILHLTDHYPPVLGGIETHVEGLTRRQAGRGDDVTVVTCSPARADGRRVEDLGPATVHRVRSLAETRGLDLSRFDLVHAHLSVVAPFTAPLAARAAAAGRPTVVTVHSLWSGMGPVPGIAAGVVGLRGAPVRWTAVSRLAAEQLALQLPQGTDVQVLPNAVDVVPRPDTPSARVDGSVRLVSTMRIARRKRPRQLVAMFERLVRTVDVPVGLTIVGDGSLRPRLERQISRAGLRDLVRVTGRVAPHRVTALLAASDVYVAPAILESFGLAALEARCVGLPVVGRSDSGMTDFVRSGTEGLLAAGDEEMVDRVRELVVDPGLRHRISEHNRTVPSSMTWDSALGAHESAYAELLAGTPPSLGTVRTAVVR